jgi:hypothetical protein
MKPKISNSNFIQLSCELASNRVTEEEPYFNAYSIGGKYTEAGQDAFNEFYDYYQNVLKNHLEEVK